jgi:hypothetical protein
MEINEIVTYIQDFAHAFNEDRLEEVLAELAKKEPERLSAVATAYNAYGEQRPAIRLFMEELEQLTTKGPDHRAALETKAIEAPAVVRAIVAPDSELVAFLGRLSRTLLSPELLPAFQGAPASHDYNDAAMEIDLIYRRRHSEGIGILVEAYNAVRPELDAGIREIKKTLAKFELLLKALKQMAGLLDVIANLLKIM